ncbi:MAG: hypothetical protein JWS10_1822 [Cypionkella sp.]|nr:hypothetical protein [Cypionkella sp.]MDB5659207.1 hypothetical protein [Cypionkella sp.]
MKKPPRWLKSAIAVSTDLKQVLPWARSQRSRPEAMKAAPAKTRAQAAR